MNGRRNNRARNNELPIPPRGPDVPTPEARIELAPAPDIDIAQDHLGILFTERRRALGLKVEEIAEDIKVKADYLRAIEQERFDLLPTLEYARLFIKAYAERLGFSLPEVFALLDVSASMATPAPALKPKGALPQAEPNRRPPTPSEATVAVEGTRRRPLVIWGVVSVAAVTLGVVAWIVLTSGKSKRQPAATPAQSTASIPVVPTPESALDEEADSLPLIHATVTAEPMNLALQFAGATWTFLEADHDTVVRRIIKAGERIDASAVESIVLSLGHTDGVVATLNGRTIGPLNTWGRQLNRYLITQDSVLAWFGAGQTGSSNPVPGDSPHGGADTGGVR